MRGKTLLYIDQFGGRITASTVKELCRKAGPTRAEKIYTDRDGRTYHIGYKVGYRWFTAYRPVELERMTPLT